MNLKLKLNVFCVSEEQADSGGDGWIDTARGRTRGNDEDDTESSTYFRNKSAQGQKRKKAPFFKYSKKKKGCGNTSSGSKGSVECCLTFHHPVGDHICQ